MEKREPGAFNQALIEVGALVCIPNGSPKCGECPLESVCLAKRNGLCEELPVKPSKKPRKIVELTVLVIRDGERVALRKRPDTGLLASLYEFPNQEGRLALDTAAQAAAAVGVAESAVEAVTPLGEAKHIFSHVEWHMTGYEISMKGQIPGCFISADVRELEGRYPLPNAFMAYKKAFLKA